MISADIGCCIYNNTDSFPVLARDETVLDESTQAQFHIVATPSPHLPLARSSVEWTFHLAHAPVKDLSLVQPYACYNIIHGAAEGKHLLSFISFIVLIDRQ